MSEEQQRNAMRMARQLRTRSDMLAKSLFVYQDQHQLSDEQLAQAVGVSVEMLARLAGSEWPLPEEEIAALVLSLKADGPTLMEWLKTEAQEEK